jgi:hypothetical protein
MLTALNVMCNLAFLQQRHTHSKIREHIHFARESITTAPRSSSKKARLGQQRTPTDTARHTVPVTGANFHARFNQDWLI